MEIKHTIVFLPRTNVCNVDIDSPLERASLLSWDPGSPIG